MAEDSLLWTTTAGTGDGPIGGYTQQNWLDFHRYLFNPDLEATAGVLPRKGNTLACSGTASPVAVNTGAAFVYGFFYKNTASLNLTVSTPTLGTTGFRVVLRASWAAQTVRAAIVSNSNGVAAIPAVTQSAGTTWEISLATGTITTGGVIALTDARVYLNIATNVSTAMLEDSSVTAAKIATAVAGNGLAGGAGTALSVNVDSSTIEINTDTLRVKDLGITTAKMALNSVDDTIAGNRVPQFYRRQGGSATNWTTAGTTTRTPLAVRMQGGSISVPTGGFTTVNFPVSFTNQPLVFGQINGSLGKVNVVGVSNTSFDVQHDLGTTQVIFWFAVGDE